MMNRLSQQEFQGWLLISLFLGLWYAITGLILPITQDEAYYFTWGQNLDWGYFDHPPAVAALAYLSQLLHLPHRFTTHAVSLLTLFGLAKLLVVAGIRGQRLLAALCLYATSFAGLTLGILTTPDTILATAWVFALYHGACALKGQSLSWISCGVFTGIGLLSKYTMVLIGPVLLVGLSVISPRSLQSKWPYIGGVVAWLIFSPHILWNKNHDWISILFQTNHGLNLTQIQSLPSSHLLPQPVLPTPDQKEFKLALPYLEKEQEKEKEKNKKQKEQQHRDASDWTRWPQVSGFYEEHLKPILKPVLSIATLILSQLAFLGFGLVALFKALRLRKSQRLTRETGPLHSYLVAGATIPIGFFALFAPFSTVETNWPLMYLFAWIPLCALLPIDFKTILRWGGMNVLIVLLLAIHSWHPFLKIRPDKDRLLQETHGFKQLATWLSDQNQVVFAETYQQTAMLRYYQPQLSSYQWPGISRPSQFILKELPKAHEILQQQTQFKLLSSFHIPPVLEGFSGVDHTQVIDCIDQLMLVKPDSIVSCTPIHTWYITQYNAKDPAE